MSHADARVEQYCTGYSGEHGVQSTTRRVHRESTRNRYWNQESGDNFVTVMTLCIWGVISPQPRAFLAHEPLGAQNKFPSITPIGFDARVRSVALSSATATRSSIVLCRSRADFNSSASARVAGKPSSKPARLGKEQQHMP